MAKDPAFLFYPGDWNLGTMHMTLLEKGCYMELLILQFAKGKFTEAQAKHMLNGSFDLAWANISEKFKTDGTFYWNERLRVEKEKRQKFTESRRSNGSIEKKEKKEAKHMLKHMEDENINKDTPVTSFNTKPKFSDFNGLPEIKIGSVIQLFKITKQTDISNEDVKGLWEIFKDQNLTGKKFYEDEDAVYSHFINWTKKQNIEKKNGTDKQPVGTTKFNVGANQLLERLKGQVTPK